MEFQIEDNFITILWNRQNSIKTYSSYFIILTFLYIKKENVSSSSSLFPSRWFTTFCFTALYLHLIGHAYSGQTLLSPPSTKYNLTSAVSEVTILHTPFIKQKNFPLALVLIFVETLDHKGNLMFLHIWKKPNLLNTVVFFFCSHSCHQDRYASLAETCRWKYFKTKPNHFWRFQNLKRTITQLPNLFLVTVV
jgi:hypothetical protein